MNFTPNVDLGNILTVLSLMFGLWQFHKANIKRIHRVEFKVNLMWKRFAHQFQLPESLEDDSED